MFEHARMLDRIERALEDHPFCPVCGVPTSIDDEGGRLWLTCSARMTPHTVIERLSAAILPHERRLLADLSEDLAA